MFRPIAASLVFACVFALGHGCATQVKGGDSESHFLGDCSAGCGEGLSCRCGVCTKACEVKADCAEVSPRAECVEPLDPGACAGGELRSCDVACLGDDGCASLGSGIACVGGRCRPEGTPGPEAGAGGAGSGGAGSGGASSGGADPGSGGMGVCQPRKTYPAPPAPGSVGTPGGSREIVAVQWSADLGDTQERGGVRFRDVGFDLDDTCTTSDVVSSPDGYSCQLPTYGTGMLDGIGSVDNALGAIIQSLRDLISDFSSENMTQQLQRGARNIVLRVAGYNGEPNDDQVRVELFTAGPFDAFAESGATVPLGDGTDVWPLASDSVVANDRTRPRAFDDLAYVSGSRLVASLPIFTWRLNMGLSSLQAEVYMALPLSGAFVACDVVPTLQGAWGFTLTGCTLAGKLPADSFLHQLSQFPDPLQLSNAKPLCTDSGAYRAFKQNICERVDVFDGTSSSSTLCNSLSFGMTFDALPALLGEVYPVDPVLPRCPAEYEPSNDSCATIGAPPPPAPDSGADASPDTGTD